MPDYKKEESNTRIAAWMSLFPLVYIPPSCQTNTGLSPEGLAHPPAGGRCCTGCWLGEGIERIAQGNEHEYLKT